jgi:hypothetical protein
MTPSPATLQEDGAPGFLKRALEARVEVQVPGQP